MRTATPLNISEQPGTGMAYVIRNLKTGELIRCATAAHRDLHRGSKIKSLRAFSGDEPYFIAKVGSKRSKFEVLKFLCGAHHDKCLDETGTYEWTGTRVDEAKKKKLKFIAPGRANQNEEQPAMRGAAKMDPRALKNTKIPFKIQRNMFSGLRGLNGAKMKMFAVVFIPQDINSKNEGVTASS